MPKLPIVLVYFILASVWIMIFDRILILLDFGKNPNEWLQICKEFHCILIIGLLIFFVQRCIYRNCQDAEQQRMAGINHALKNSRKLLSHVQTLREEDRTSIAREIHDELGQSLTGIQIQLRLIENRLADREDRTLNPLIDKLVETSEWVNTTIASVQRISANLRPNVLNNLGLADALNDEAKQFLLRTGIPCTIEVSSLADDLIPEISMTVFQIFQESLSNIAHHADAHQIKANLSIIDNILKLVIHDDGKGIDPTVIEDPKSLGLIRMLKRAKNVGGGIVFSRYPQQGTNVILTIPLLLTHGTI